MAIPSAKSAARGAKSGAKSAAKSAAKGAAKSVTDQAMAMAKGAGKAADAAASAPKWHPESALAKKTPTQIRAVAEMWGVTKPNDIIDIESAMIEAQKRGMTQEQIVATIMDPGWSDVSLPTSEKIRWINEEAEAVAAPSKPAAEAPAKKAPAKQAAAPAAEEELITNVPADPAQRPASTDTNTTLADPPARVVTPAAKKARGKKATGKPAQAQAPAQPASPASKLPDLEDIDDGFNTPPPKQQAAQKPQPKPKQAPAQQAQQAAPQQQAQAPVQPTPQAANQWPAMGGKQPPSPPWQNQPQWPAMGGQSTQVGSAGPSPPTNTPTPPSGQESFFVTPWFVKAAQAAGPAAVKGGEMAGKAAYNAGMWAARHSPGIAGTGAMLYGGPALIRHLLGGQQPQQQPQQQSYSLPQDAAPQASQQMSMPADRQQWQDPFSSPRPAYQDEFIRAIEGPPR